MSQHHIVTLLTQLQQDHQLLASQLADIAGQVDQLNQTAGTRKTLDRNHNDRLTVLETTAAGLVSRLERLENEIANLWQRPAPPTPSHGSTVSMFAGESDSDSDAGSPAPRRIASGGNLLNIYGEFLAASEVANCSTSSATGAHAAATAVERTGQAAAAALGHDAPAPCPANTRVEPGGPVRAPHAESLSGAGLPGRGPVLHIEQDRVKQILLDSSLSRTEALDKNALARGLLRHLPPEDRELEVQYVIGVVNKLLYQLEREGTASRRQGPGPKPLWRRT